MSRFCFLVFLLLLSGCADFAYLRQAAQGHLDVLWRARPVEELITEESTPERLKIQLDAARRMRNFAVERLNLPDNQSYKRYADVGQPYVVWNVFATEELSLQLKHWCFPVVGCLNYKGYYSQSSAEAFGTELRNQGLEVSVAGIPAYSTLGFTPDPLLNTFVFYPEGELARMMFHELAHQVVYINDDTTFNESFASTVEELGVERWLSEQSSPEQKKLYAEFESRKRRFIQLLLDSKGALKTLYAQDVSDSFKRMRKQLIFSELQVEYERIKQNEWQGYQGYDRFFQSGVNNARLSGIGLYRQWVPAFKGVFYACKQEFACFYKTVGEIGRLGKSAREQRLSTYENPELAATVLLPDFVVR
ncbi:MAG: aminopeptidase [Burkholderiales bacterium]|jgi:predicted aminopeptidase|nr:aminopeptidase [Burkholderiales bacterium]